MEVIEDNMEEWRATAVRIRGTRQVSDNIKPWLLHPRESLVSRYLHRIGGWMVPRPGLNTMEMRLALAPARNQPPDSWVMVPAQTVV